MQSEHNIEIGHQILSDKMTTIATLHYIFQESIEKPEIQKHFNYLNRDNGYNINKI